MRTESPSIKFRGALARAIEQVYHRREPGKDVSGTIPCTWCSAKVSFTVMPSGMSRGHCAGACGVRWLQ